MVRSLTVIILSVPSLSLKFWTHYSWTHLLF